MVTLAELADDLQPMGVPAPEVVPADRPRIRSAVVVRMDRQTAASEDVSITAARGARRPSPTCWPGRYTDAVVIVHDGRIVYEQYSNGMAADTPPIP